MSSPLDHLLEEGIITEVVGRLQSGKEAEVFLVRFAERVVAAKVYKDQTQRSFKNNAAYKEGRAVRNTRDQRAMDKRSRFGKSTQEAEWKSAEADALYRLHAADVRVPAPVLFFEGVLLMELVVDDEGNTARRLIDSSLSAEEANAAYHDMLRQLVRMLACDLIHGDLSPYNVLWGAGGVTIIDFPQMVAAAKNTNSERFFMRDAENILGHFRRIDPRLEARRGDASEIWNAYVRRDLTADFIPTGRARQPAPQRPLPIGVGRPPTPQRPLPIGTGRPSVPQAAYESRGGGSPQQQRGGGSPQQQRGGGSPQQQRGGGSPRQQRGGGSPQQQRGGGPSHQQRSAVQPAQSPRGAWPPAQQDRGGQRGGQAQRGQPQHGQPQRGQAQRGQPQHGQAQRGQPQRDGGPPSHAQRGGGSSAPSRSRQPNAGSNFGQQRRAMPEVIVRPRVGASARPAPASADTAADTADSREADRNGAAKRR